MCRGQRACDVPQNSGPRPFWLGGVPQARDTTNAEPGAVAGASLELVGMIPRLRPLERPGQEHRPCPLQFCAQCTG